MKRGLSRVSAAVTATLACCLLPAGLRGEASSGDLALPLDTWDQAPDSTRADVVKAGPHGERCLRIAVSAASWESQLRRTLVYQRPIARVVFEGAFRAENVVEGSSPEARVRALLSFLGEGGRVGECPPASKIAGTTAWRTLHQELAAPAGTLGVRLMIGPTLTTGTSYFHGLRVTAYDQGGAIVTPLASPTARTDTSGWCEFVPGREDVSRPLVLDPALYHLPSAEQTGWARAQGGRLVFEKTGEEVHFQEFETLLRGELGVRALITGSNHWENRDRERSC
jgi:hypothetical protein